MDAWWALDVHEVLKKLGTGREGLSDEEVERRLKEHGPNTIHPKRRRGLAILIRQFSDPIIVILIFSSLLLFSIKHFAEAAVVVLIVLISAILGFAQEWKAEKTIEGLRELIRYRVKVRRKGITRAIDSAEIVPGDILFLEAGMKVPADARIIRSRELFVDESILTGESTSVEKSGDTVGEDVPLSDRTCMLYAGTMVVNGSGLAAVVATGNETEIGRISEMIEVEEEIDTLLLAKIRLLGKQLSIAIIIVSTLNFIIGSLRGYDLIYTFIASLSLAVAAIPEALPALVTVSLAIGVKEMAGRQVLIRKLPAVETLGSVTVICSDKTGTLTQNKMKVIRIKTKKGDYVVKEDGIYDGDRKSFGEDLKLILSAGYVCNSVSYEVENGKIIFHGDPTETALLEVALKTGVKPEYELIDEIPFDSKRRYMAVAVEMEGQSYVFVKGAPEVIAAMTDGKLAMAETCASLGVRVLAFAYRRVEKFEGFELDDLEFLGYQCLIDPLREDSFPSVRSCERAGIRVVMVTGDHPTTAASIARALRIDGEVITGRELEDTELDRAVKKYSVFARVSPEQKLQIVKTFQEQGEVVAVTGDGVNDAPALKRADIGVAMGEGSDVAKEAADMIILDNAFSSILRAVEVGRDVFRKIQRIFSWILPTNGGQSAIILTAFLLGIPLPMQPLHILWINTVTAALLGTMLVFDRMEGGLLDLKPTKGELLNRVIASRVIYISLLTVVIAYYLYYESGKMSAAVNSIIAVGMWYLLTPYVDRSFFEAGVNRFVVVGILLTLILQLIVTNFEILQLEALSLVEWMKVLTASSAVFLVVEIEKNFISKSKTVAK